MQIYIYIKVLLSYIFLNIYLMNFSTRRMCPHNLLVEVVVLRGNGIMDADDGDTIG
jgi:hypothetical protein